jgi:uncharacterized delta-60 repeat protein
VVNGACYVAGVDTGELVNGTGFCSADGLLYVAGAPANGVVNGVLYQQGVAYNGIYQGGLYTNGVKVSLDGALDKETFQGTGFTKSEVGITSNTEWLAPTTVLIQSDSKIVVVGHAYSDYDGNRVILRYLEDGTPDASFGTAGAVVLPGANWIVGAFQYGEKLILATSQVIFRLNADGSPDRGFGQNGQVNLDAVGEFRYDRRIALQPDGRIIVAGLESNTQIQGGLQLALGRFDTDGLLDNSFGTAGIVNMHDLVAMDSLTAATQTDGKILISYAQQTSPGSRESHGTIYRFNHDGSVDTSFGDQGKVTPAGAPGFHWITSQPYGGVLAALYNTVYRFNSKGELDLSFGDAGVVTLPGAPDGLWGGSGSAVVQQDGKILVNGYTRNDVIVNGNLAVKSFTSIVRLKPDGKVDDSFGTNGIQHLSFLGSRYNSTAALAIQSDGRIVGVASFVDVDGKEKIVTFRLWS